jgi:hypothetical protein
MEMLHISSYLSLFGEKINFFRQHRSYTWYLFFPAHVRIRGIGLELVGYDLVDSRHDTD